ncbi:unnamed protein product [marine sediment metagenome]|uniref:Uncharacterized protein n=1 Tax=marine sediment metagenome TaxID=412755 RepID=X1M511_9ZZZZ
MVPKKWTVPNIIPKELRPNKSATTSGCSGTIPPKATPNTTANAYNIQISLLNRSHIRANVTVTRQAVSTRLAPILSEIKPRENLPITLAAARIETALAATIAEIPMSTA